MCGRFVQERSITELAGIFEAEPLADQLAAGRYNVAPTQPAAVVVQRADGRRAIVAYDWGLIPHWAPKARIASRTFNARAETVATMPAFRDAFRRHRCLVPADGFFEWSRGPGVRQPFLIRRTDRRPMAFAGLWASWRDPITAEPKRTFTIVTTTANELIEPLHSRMPVVLLPEHWAAWLDPESPDPAGLLGHLTAAPSRPFELVPVNRLVNDVRNEGPALIEPAQVQYEFGAGAAEVRPVELSLWSEPAVEAEGPARRQRDR